jgi:hypothetical protein
MIVHVNNTNKLKLITLYPFLIMIKCILGRKKDNALNNNLTSIGTEENKESIDYKGK